MSIRERILSACTADTLPREPVTLFGQHLFVRGMTALEKDTFETRFIESRDNPEAATNYRATLLVQCLCDEHGARVFTDADADQLGNAPVAELDKALDQAKRLSALDDTEEDKLQGN